jgi:hypothetical protein
MKQILYLLTQCNNEDVLYTVYVGHCPLHDICTESVKTPCRNYLRW